MLPWAPGTAQEGPNPEPSSADGYWMLSLGDTCRAQGERGWDTPRTRSTAVLEELLQQGLDLRAECAASSLPPRCSLPAGAAEEQPG